MTSLSLLLLLRHNLLVIIVCCCIRRCESLMSLSASTAATTMTTTMTMTMTPRNGEHPALAAPCEEQQQQQQQQHPIGFYVHIPYCRRRCRYCNFSIVPIGFPNKEGQQQQQQQQSTSSSFDIIHEQYQADLLAELDQILIHTAEEYHDNPNQAPIRLSSIYFGGGTPSLAPVEMIQAILQKILGTKDHSVSASASASALFVLENDAEITMEMDPGTFSTEQLQSLRELGINRISLGVQSLDDAILESMGRVHRVVDVRQALDSIQEVFGSDNDKNDNDDDNDIDHTVHNYSIDLISGVPGLTLAKWIQTLEEATSLVPRPSHISIYDLQIEQGTVFSTWYGDTENTHDAEDESDRESTRSLPSKTSKIGRIPALPSEESVAFMYKFSAGYLRAKGFEHYEVSSYAYHGGGGDGDGDGDGGENAVVDMASTKGSSRRSRHNQIYWAPSSSWYAAGLGATSFVKGQLVARPKTMADYRTWVQNHPYQQPQQQKQTHKSELDDEKEDQIKASTVVKRDEDDLLTDIIMKRLRTSDGLDLDWIGARFGKDVRETILKGASLGLELDMAEMISSHHRPVVDDDDDDNEDDDDSTVTSSVQDGPPPNVLPNTLRLKDPNGFLYSNYIISSIFAELGYE